jgi:hypothetical protein
MSRARDLGSLINSTAAGKNFLINGGMEIDQRNTASSAVTINTALRYTVDRWFLYNPSATNVTAQRVSGSNLGTQFALQINGATGFTGGNFAQRVESFHIAPLANQRVTFSIKVFSTVAIANAQLYGISCSAARDAVYDTTMFSQAVSISPGLNNLSVTTTLPASIINGGEFGLATGTIPSGQNIQISLAQVEIGSSLTQFSRSGGNLQTELAACQRYYQRFNGADHFATAARFSTTGVWMNIPTKTTMRSVPSVAISSSSHLAVGSTTGSTTIAANSFTQNSRTSVNNLSVSFTHSTADGSVGGAATVIMDNVSGYIEAASEL